MAISRFSILIAVVMLGAFVYRVDTFRQVPFNWRAKSCCTVSSFALIDDHASFRSFLSGKKVDPVVLNISQSVQGLELNVAVSAYLDNLEKYGTQGCTLLDLLFEHSPTAANLIVNTILTDNLHNRSQFVFWSDYFSYEQKAFLAVSTLF